MSSEGNELLFLSVSNNNSYNKSAYFFFENNTSNWPIGDYYCFKNSWAQIGRKHKITVNYNGQNYKNILYDPNKEYTDTIGTPFYPQTVLLKSYEGRMLIGTVINNQFNGLKYEDSNWSYINDESVTLTENLT